MVGSSVTTGPAPALSDGEFEYLLDDLISGPGLPHLPAEFSRADSYANHDWRGAVDLFHPYYSELMSLFRRIIAILVMTWSAAAQEHVSFPTPDGGLIHADLYGTGDRAVVLAHGGRFNKESWKKQALALEKAGFRVLAIDFRWYGQSRGPGDADPLSAPLQLDVLAAVRYLRKTGAKTVSVVGGSMGGTAAGAASALAEPGEIERLVFLGCGGSEKYPEKMKGRKLFIIARDDVRSGDIPRLPRVRELYQKATEPKELIILEGSAHAQFVFATDQGERVMREILRFLAEK